MARPLRVSLYASAREAVGKRMIEVPVPPEGIPVRELLALLGRKYRPLAPVLPACRVARNGRYIAAISGRLRPGDEVAIHPPYSGG